MPVWTEMPWKTKIIEHKRFHFLNWDYHKGTALYNLTNRNMTRWDYRITEEAVPKKDLKVWVTWFRLVKS